MSDPSLEQRWDAELEKRGLAAVTLLLDAYNVGIGRNAEVRLFVPGLENPQRDYVEGWIRRKEGEGSRLAEDRHRETLRVGEEALRVSRKGVRWAFWAFVMGALSVLIGLVFGLLGK